MTRWLALILGLAVAATALYAFVKDDVEAPLGEIDAASRHSLERVLEQAEREGGRVAAEGAR